VSSNRAKILLGVAIAFLVVLVIGVVVASSSDSSKTSNRSTQQATTRDGFKRANASTLGQSDNGKPWKAVAGTWGIQDNAAYVVTSAGALKRSIAVIDSGAQDGTAQVKMKTIASGSGLIFRYAGPYNYWVCPRYLSTQPGLSRRSRRRRLNG
jgi:septal ring-binding cell division protein DamX